MKNIRTHFFRFLLVGISLSVLLFGGAVYAAPGGSGSTGGAGGSGSTGAAPTVRLQNPLSGIGTIPELVAALLKVVVQIGVPVIIFFLVYVGFLFVTARGNEEQISRAKNAFLWTVIGGVILLGAQLLASVVENTVKQITG